MAQAGSTTPSNCRMWVSHGEGRFRKLRHERYAQVFLAALFDSAAHAGTSCGTGRDCLGPKQWCMPSDASSFWLQLSKKKPRGSLNFLGFSNRTFANLVFITCTVRVFHSGYTRHLFPFPILSSKLDPAHT